MKSSTMMGGASDSHERHKSDFYETPRDCTIALLRHAPHFRKLKIWECADGDGAISTVLREMNIAVTGTDIRTTKTCLGGVNFLTADPPAGTEAIITNPPFNLAREFIYRAREFEMPFAFVLKMTFWNVATNRECFVKTGPAEVCPMGWRPTMAPERGDNPTMEFCWTIWDGDRSHECTFYPLTRPMVYP